LVTEVIQQNLRADRPCKADIGRRKGMERACFFAILGFVTGSGCSSSRRGEASASNPVKPIRAYI
jgi:hypothetical protein